MRDIKFRVWDKSINKMITQENVKEFLDKTISEKWEDEFPYHSDEWYPAYEILTIFDYLKSFQERTIKRYEPSENRFDIMQYTGLKDKNGKEIYESDIVYIASEDENAFVLWDKETARYIIQFNSWCADFDNFYGKELEVIGNIYNNPELLREGE